MGGSRFLRKPAALFAGVMLATMTTFAAPSLARADSYKIDWEATAIASGVATGVALLIALIIYAASDDDFSSNPQNHPVARDEVNPPASAVSTDVQPGSSERAVDDGREHAAPEPKLSWQAGVAPVIDGQGGVGKGAQVVFLYRF